MPIRPPSPARPAPHAATTASTTAASGFQALPDATLVQIGQARCASISTISAAVLEATQVDDVAAFLRGLPRLEQEHALLQQVTTVLRARHPDDPLTAGFQQTVETTALALTQLHDLRRQLEAKLAMPAANSAVNTAVNTTGFVTYARERRLHELVLGGDHTTHVVTMSSPHTAPTEPLKPHTVRLSASGMFSKTDTRLGDKPVLAPAAGPDGLAIRRPHPHPAWAVREALNRTFLEPGAVFSQNDAFDFQLFRNSPTATAAVAELAAVLAPPGTPQSAPLDVLYSGQRLDLEKLSPPARFLAELARFFGPGATLHGALQGGLTRLFGRYGDHFQLDEATAAKHLGAGNAAWLFLMLREVVPERRGLQQVMHRSTLPMEPVDSRTPLTREEAEALQRDDVAALQAMCASAPVPQTLRALEATKPLIKDDAFKDVHIVAVQHVLSTNATMFSAIEEKGGDPAKTEIVGIPYSTNYVVENVLRQRGYRIETPLVVDPNDITAAYERAVEGALARAVERAQQDGKPILLIDDGGKASAVASRKYPHLAHLFRAVEQTTRGLTELQNIEQERGGPVPFPVVDVAKSPLKAHEMPKIGAQVVGEIDKITRLIGMEVVAGKDVMVTGFGPIGRGVALALRDRGARVTIWDQDPAVRARAVADGFVSPDDRGQAFAGKALIVGATGHRSVTRDDIALMGHECVLASASSRDVEIDLSVNRDRDVETVPLLTAGRGDRRFVTRVWRFGDGDGDKSGDKNGAKDIVVLKNGFPLNFNGDYETGTPEDIEQTRAIMLMGAAQAVNGVKDEDASRAPGIQPLSLDAQRAFAVAFGIDARF